MRSTNKSRSLSGSALLKINPQILWRKAFSASRSQTSALAAIDNSVQETLELPSNAVNMSAPERATPNALIRSQAIYMSEPDDVRRCIEKLLPNQAFNLVLTNKVV